MLEPWTQLLRSWGCRVVSADSASAALEVLGHDSRPDLIISDYRLSNGRTGIETIEELRAALRSPIPAFLISGDTDPERLRDARAGGYHLLHKPVRPMALRAMVSQLWRQEPADTATGRGCSRGRGPRQLPAELADRDHRLGAVGRLQRSEDGGDVILHGRLGQLQGPADPLLLLPCIMSASTSI